MESNRRLQQMQSGCTNCYAEDSAWIRSHNPKTPQYKDVVDPASHGWNGKTAFVESAIEKPLHWKSPRVIFVCSMSDIFHETVPFEWVDKVIDIAEQTPHHKYLLLTKRPERMKEYYESRDGTGNIQNIGIGVTACTQAEADEKIPVLLSIPAAMRFISIEPMLERIILPRVNFHCDLCGGTGLLARWPKGKCHHCDGKGYIPAISTDPRFGMPTTPMRFIDWVLLSGESGHNARPMHPDWARGVQKQCADAGVSFLFKQWGEWIPMCQQERSKKYPDIVADDANGCPNGGYPDNRVYSWPNEVMESYRCGRKNAGNLLDGKAYHEYPKFFER